MIARNDLEDIRSIEADLPPPDAMYSGMGATFHIYTAKEWLKPDWKSPILKKALLLCRKTFLRYGNRTLLDKYDPKAAVYLVRASYKTGGINNCEYDVCEWLSVRLVPGWGNPLGCGELEIYSLHGWRLDKILKEVYFKNKRYFWRKIISGSRICGIKPYFKDLESNSWRSPLHEQKFTAICFALLINKFISDCKEGPMYLTGIIHDKFVDNKMTIISDGKEYKPKLTAAYEFLGLRSGRLIKLDRNIYTYKFPAYWLNMGQLIDLLQRLAGQELLTEASFRYYMGSRSSYKRIIEKQLLPESYNLGRLLTVKGKIKHSEITGRALRRMVDLYVDDSPELKITRIKDWNDSIEEIVRISGVKLIS